MLTRGFLGEHGVDLTGFAEVLGSARSWRIIGHTLFMAVAGTAGAVLLGIPGAYILYRCRFPGQSVLRGISTIPFVLPTVVVGVAFRALFGPGGPLQFLGLDQTTAAVVLAMVFFNFSVVVRQVGALWQVLDPRTVDAARTLGASPLRAFTTVTLPASKTGLAHLLIGSFIPAKASDAFKIRVPDAQTAVRSIIGGTLMGWGTAWAGGCTIGNAMVNTATFSFQGWTALLFMVLGTGAAAKIFIMRHQGTGSRPPTARSAPSPWWRPSRPWSSCRRVTSSSSTSTAPRPPTRCPSWPPRTATRSPSSSSAAPPNGRSPYRSPEQRRRRLLDWHGHSLTSSSGSNPRMRNHSRSS